jgi:hypothetical protein
MFVNKVTRFNHIFKHSEQEVKERAEVVIRGLYEDAATWESGLSFRLRRRLGLQPTRAAVRAYLVTVLLLLASFSLLFLLRPLVGAWSFVVSSLLTIGVTLYTVVYMAASSYYTDRVWAEVSSSARWELTAERMVECWVGERLDVDDLKPAAEASLNDLKLRRAFLAGLVFTAGAFVTLHKLLTGREALSLVPWVTELPAGYASWAFGVAFLIAATWVFVRISAPIWWRVQLGPYLERAVEKHKAREEEGRGQPRKSRRRLSSV